MANGQRSPKEMETDFKKIRKIAETATSIKEIEIATGLSTYQINRSLLNHPILSKAIKEQLATNRKKAKLENKQQKEILEVKNDKSNSSEDNISSIVLDASITGFSNLKNLLSEFTQMEKKIILTSITIKELKRMESFKDVQAKDSTYILSLAVEHPNQFETVLIDETLGTHDNCIIKYCADNKDTVCLLTSDKEMVLTARMYGITVRYFKQDQDLSHKNVSDKIRTLLPAKRIGDNLLISNFHTQKMSISVYSKGKEYSDIMKKLEIGDDVFVSTKKSNYITFAHYRIISLYAENNCELIFSRRIYDYKEDLDTILQSTYKSFIKKFISTHNL